MQPNTSSSQSGITLLKNTNSAGSLRFEFVSRDFATNSGVASALKQINLTINAGEFVAIMGYSGSGKSTLLNILGLLDSPTSGTYYIGEVDTSQLSQSKRARMRRDKFGIIFQNFNLLNRYTVVQNIELALAYQRVPKSASQRLAINLLQQLGLADKAHMHPQQLSGGQAQRIAIARALINNPPIILADEPTGNLDYVATQEIVQLLKTLHQQGSTVVMVTHSNEVAAAASRIIHMQDGQIVSEEQSHAA